jgi:hypothetical protein
MGSSLLSSLGALSLVETVAEVVFFVVIVSAFAFFIVAIGNRSDADPTGSRPIAAYLFSGAFLFIWIAYFGIAAAAFSLVNLIGGHPAAPFLETVSYGNEAIRACVLGALLVVLAGGAGFLHLQKGNALADAEANPSGPTKRVMRSYVALVSFIAVLIIVLALIVALWLVFGLISPTIFLASSSRTVTSRGILDALVLVILGAAIFSYHQRFAPASLRTFSSIGRSAPGHSVSESTPPTSA